MGEGVYNALLAWKVDFDLAKGTTGTLRERERGVGHADLLIQAAMVTFGEESEAAELRVSEDYAERIADIN